MLTRRSGILMHITSLPGKYGIGDFGPQAYKFADLLKAAGQGYWQVLPLNHLGFASHGSPYSATSAFAINTLLISPEMLHEDGLLTSDDVQGAVCQDEETVDHTAIGKHKTALLAKAAVKFLAGHKDGRFEEFCHEQKGWLDDFALFIALAEAMPDREWCDWPKELRDRQPDALKDACAQHQNVIMREKVLQFLAMTQWKKLKEYCNQQGVKMIGDVPIYVVYHGSDVWSHPEFFKLDRSRKPTATAGVPPDAFSKTGQLWGNPVYDWDAIKKDGYRWWLARISMNLRMLDMVRLDHFRGFAGYWEIPAGEEMAAKGRWMSGPGEDFFKAVLAHIESPAIIAEDLGVITADVRELIAKFNLPSMKVLLFAFEEGNRSNAFLPHNHMPNSVVYTGTHDNNTVRGWYEKDATKGEKLRLVRLAMMSSSMLAIIPVQDALGLGADTRMNHPGKARGNWKWRANSRDLTSHLAAKLRHITEIYDRA
jgi:4-alpha-glucanotransferase